MAEALPPVKVVYLGRRTGNDGKVYNAFIPYDDLQKLAGPHDAERVEFRSSLYKAKRAPAVIGGTYEGTGEINEEKILRLSLAGLKYAGKENHPHLGVWEAADQAAYVASRKASMEAKAAKDRHLTDAVERIRRTYKNLQPGDRLTFQLWLHREITK